MKWIILLILLIVVFAFIALRYRQQIKMGIYVWRMFKKMRQMSKPDDRQIENQGSGKEDTELVRCAKCGTWTPQNKAINLRSGMNYCSTACLETAVNAG